MKHMKCIRAGILVFILCTFNLLSIFAEESSKTGKYPYNAVTSQKFNADVYGDPFGKFIEAPKGKENEASFIKDGKPGEYQYIGYTYEEDWFSNDKWFGKADSKGNVFDNGYTDIKWLKSNEAPDSWGKVEEHPNCEQLTKCIITAKFYDSDHVTDDYIDFMAATGLSNGLPNPKSYLKSAQKNNNGETVNLPRINGAMVIDRTLDDPNELFKMYGSHEAVNIIMGE